MKPTCIRLLVTHLFLLSFLSVSFAQETQIDAIIKVTNKCPFTIWSHGFGFKRGTPNSIPLHGGVAEEMKTGDVIIYDSLSTMGGGRLYAYYKQPTNTNFLHSQQSPYNQFVEFTIDKTAMNYNISYVDHCALPVSMRAVKYNASMGPCEETASNVCWSDWVELMKKCPTKLTHPYNDINSCLASYEYCLFYGGQTDYCKKMETYTYPSLDGGVVTFEGYRIYGGDFTKAMKYSIYRNNEGSPEAFAFWEQVAAWNRGTFGGDYDENNYYNDPQQVNGVWTKPYNEYAKWVHEDIGAQIYAFSTDDHQEKSGFVQCRNSKVLEVVWCPCDATLPVEYLSFNGINEGCYNNLLWTTTNEVNNSHFVVERSSDGKKFEPIDEVKAIGNGSSILKYTSKDNQPLDGINYYRLKQVDEDGKSMFSEVISIDNRNTNKVKLYPLPAKDIITIEISTCSLKSVILFDALGRILNTYTGDLQNTMDIDISYYSKGMYMFQVLTEEGNIYREKLIKE